MSNDKIVELGAVKAEIVSYASGDDSPSLPALALKVAPSAQGSLEFVRELDNHELFEITGLMHHDDKWVRVIMNSKDESSNLSEIGVTILIPTPMITVAFALMLAPGSFSILLLNSASARLTSGMLIDGDKRVLSKIAFPSLSDARHESIQKVLSDISGSAYANPFFPGSGDVDDMAVKHFDVDDLGISNYTRIAQGKLLSVLSSLTRGDKVSASMALSLSNQLAETFAYRTERDIDSLSPEVRENINVYKYLIQYLISGIIHSTPHESMSVPAQEMSFEPTDAELERSFVEIVSSFIEDSSDEEGESHPMSALRYLTPLPDEQLQQIRVPFTTDYVPAAQQSVHDYVRTELGDERYAQIVDYAQYNWLRVEVLNFALENAKGKESDVFLALLLIMAARADIVKHTKTSNSTYWLTSMLTMNGDSRLWEIVSLAPALENYDISTLEDLMHTNGKLSHDPDAKKLFFYINLFINGLASYFLMEDIDEDDVEALFEELDFEQEYINDVKALFMEILGMLQEDYDDCDEEDAVLPEYTIPASVIEKMISAWTEPKISRALSLAIPMLADGYALLNGHEIGTNEWSAYRKEHIEEILLYVDDIAPGVHR